jgi:ribosome-associated protein
MIEINDSLSIQEAELSFRFSRSSGPGGQNVNKVSTKVTLLFDVACSPSLSEDQRSLIMRRLGTRITRAGVLRISSQKHRSQSANREASIERFGELLRMALERSRPRRKTRMPKSARERRLEQKKRRGTLKRQRGGGCYKDE